MEGPHRLGDIAARAGVGKPSTHRILQELTDRGFARLERPGYYAPGPRLIALASEVLGEDRWSHGVLSVLQALRSATGHTVHFAIRSGHEAIYVQKLNADQPYQMVSKVGMRIPLYCTSIGKFVLAWLDAEEIGSLWSHLSFTARTPNTLTSRQELEKELLVVRSEGFAIDNEENELNVRCVGAPVFDHKGQVIGGVSVSALVFQLSSTGAIELAPTVVKSGFELSSVISAFADQGVEWRDVVRSGISANPPEEGP